MGGGGGGGRWPVGRVRWRACLPAAVGGDPRGTGLTKGEFRSLAADWEANSEAVSFDLVHEGSQGYA